VTDRYNYDAEGNYTGMSSDTPPNTGGGCGGLVGLIILVVIGLAYCGKSDDKTTATPPANQTEAQTQTQANPPVSVPTTRQNNAVQPQNETNTKWEIKD
jgi:predicted metalloprotease